MTLGSTLRARWKFASDFWTQVSSNSGSLTEMEASEHVMVAFVRSTLPMLLGRHSSCPTGQRFGAISEDELV
jgi:hypothetical protein